MKQTELNQLIPPFAVKYERRSNRNENCSNPRNKPRISFDSIVRIAHETGVPAMLPQANMPACASRKESEITRYVGLIVVVIDRSNCLNLPLLQTATKL
jgi:hypothetical protein